MSGENSNVFRKENLDMYLKELSKEYKKLTGRNMPAEIILIGGAAIIENYGFRDMTTDVDAVITAASAMKDAINRVGDRFALPNGWLNSDFQKTGSYSDKLPQFSVFYKTFNQVLQIRTVTSEYLVAMKLRSGRKYKNDLSDIIGILAEHEKKGDPITFERIDKAVKDLYGSWDEIPADSVSFIQNTLANKEYERVYALVRDNEKEAKGLLLGFQEEYPGVVNEANLSEVLRGLRAKKNGQNK